MTLTDAASCRLPRPFTIMYLISGSAFRLWQGDWLTGLCSAGFWFLLLLLFRQYTSYRRKTETIGLGDVFLIAGIAIWSPPGDIPWIVATAAGGALLYLWCNRQRRITRELPFGPFLCASQYAFTFYPGGLW
ncbi:TPA: prepilin peptidase [Escherichia coli]|nr:prepilin peptidase [Escherichia coli]